MPALKDAQDPLFLVIHHTDMIQVEQVQIVDQSHERRGYAASSIINPETGTGWHIAYHYFIGKDGTVIQTRSHDERTQHTSCGLGLEKCKQTPAVNDHSLGVVLAGDFEQEMPTDAQLSALRELVDELDGRYHFKKVMFHRDASPTSCPGNNLVNTAWDLVKGNEVWNITRYYTPVHGQKRYYRTVSDKDFIHTALALGLVEHVTDEQWPDSYWHSFASGPVPIGHSLEEADQWFNDRPDYKEAIRKEMEYLADFKVNCSGDCLVPADGTRYTEQDAFKVAACPPQYPFGTRFDIEGIGIVTCHDHGSAIKGNKIDVWAGIGDTALDLMKQKPGGLLTVRLLD